jgi:peptidoglycan/LPS O-acetylase OafA/YrhL
MSAQGQDRESRLELIRIIACYLVVMNHLQVIYPIENGLFFKGRALLYGFIQINVPLFALISGYLLFQNADEILERIDVIYFKKIKKFLIHIFIPSVIVVIVTASLQTTLWEDPTVRPDYVWDYLALQQADLLCNHLWYIWTYARILLLFPLLAFVCRDRRELHIIRRWYIGLSFANLFIIDFRFVLGITAGDLGSIVFDKYILYFLLGYELYLLYQRRQENWNKVRLLGVALFVLALGGKLVIEIVYFRKYGAEHVPDTMTVIASVGAFLALYGRKSQCFSRIVTWIGSNTMYLYLVHILVLKLFEKLFDDVIWRLFGQGTTSLRNALYSIVYSAIIFTISLIVGLAFRLIYETLLVGTVGRLRNALIVARENGQ